MVETNETVFKVVKAFSEPWAAEFRQDLWSPCHLFPDPIASEWQRVVEDYLPKENPTYLEFGTFTGAGSTYNALLANPKLKVITFDLFQLTPRYCYEFDDGHTLFDATNALGEKYAAVRGLCTTLQAAMYNLWDFQDRTAIFRQRTGANLMQRLADAGVVPDLFFIDDDHTAGPTFERIEAASRLWPDALVGVDDYCSAWPAVMQSVDRAFEEGLYSKENSELLADRVYLLRK